MGPFASLLLNHQIPKVVKGIEHAVSGSFVEDRKPGLIILVSGARSAAPARTEVKRRTAICIKIFRELRGALDWSVARILDHLPKFLRCSLNGTPWEPEARRASWAAAQK